MHNFALQHVVLRLQQEFFFIFLFLLSFYCPSHSSRIKTTFQHLSFKSVSPNYCESSLISRLAECSQVFPWTAPVAGTRTRKLSAASGGRWAATRASNEPSRRLREDLTITEKTPKVPTNTFIFKTLFQQKQRHYAKQATQHWKKTQNLDADAKVLMYSVLNLKALVVSRRFHQGEGPSRGLHRDCKTSRKLSAVSGGCWAPTRRCLLSLSLDPGQCPVSPRVRTPLGRFIKMEFCNYEYLSRALMCCLLLDSYFWVKLSAGLACDWIFINFLDDLKVLSQKIRFFHFIELGTKVTFTNILGNLGLARNEIRQCS